MSRWFRYHAEVLNNKRVQNLPDNLFKVWVNCQCILANENIGANGKMPAIEDCAYSLRMSVSETVRNLDLLVDAGMLKRKNETKSETLCNDNETKNETKCNDSDQENGTFFSEQKIEYFVKGWGKKQYKSDTSTKRVKRFRERSKTVTGNAPDQIRSDTDTEQIRTESDPSDELDSKKGKKAFNVEWFLKDCDRMDAKRFAPDWNQTLLIAKFNAFIADKGENPKVPNKAYIAWVKKFTKGKAPE